MMATKIITTHRILNEIDTNRKLTARPLPIKKCDG